MENGLVGLTKISVLVVSFDLEHFAGFPAHICARKSIADNVF